MVSTVDPRLVKLLAPRLTPYIPHVPTPKQQAFLLLMCREALFGGAAGGGKSDALLMAALQFVDVPGYAALLLRRTFPDLNQPGALIPRSKEWLYTTDARWNQQEHRWTFPSGATVTFGYLDHENDVYQYQGAAFQFVGYDETTQFTEAMYLYLLSRLRRPEEGALAGVPLRMRGATNPGGIGHDWVLQRFLTAEARAAGRVFIPSKLADNPHLDAATYSENLMLLDDVTRAQLLEGDWMATRTDGVIPRRFIDRCREPKDLPDEQLVPIELGMDVGAGGDYTTIRERCGRRLGRVWRAKTPDTMAGVGIALAAIGETGASAIKIDAIGVGKGTADRLAELRREGTHGARVVPVSVGMAAFPSEDGLQHYVNLRSQIWWEIGRNLTEAGALDLSALDFQTEMDLLAPMWARDSAGRIAIEQKKDVRKRLGRSTDDGDAYLLSLYTPPPVFEGGVIVDDGATVEIGAGY